MFRSSGLKSTAAVFEESTLVAILKISNAINTLSDIPVFLE